MLELARRTADLVRSEADSQDAPVLAAALFEQVLGRPPNSEESSSAIAFLQQPVQRIEPQLDVRSLWAYGTARINDRDHITEFTPLSVFKESRWQAASEFPAKPPYGHAFLSRDSGHTPTETSMAVVRRFTAPFAGQIRLRGQAGHGQDHGDGVRVSIWIGKDRRFMETCKNNNRTCGPIRGTVEAGDTIDFVATAGQSNSFDSFSWRAVIRLSGNNGRLIETESVKHFSGPLRPDANQPLDRLSQLAQTLLMSNEFAFVD